MVSREQKSEALQEKYQLLRSVTNSNAANKESILVDASKYIQELKHKVESLNQDMNSSYSNYQTSDPSNINYENEAQSSLTKVSVETLQKGYRINVMSERSCPGLLVSILEAFEELGLEVLDANIGCEDCFQLEVVGVENDGVGNLDAQVVRQGVSQAIKKWNGSR